MEITEKCLMQSKLLKVAVMQLIGMGVVKDIWKLKKIKKDVKNQIRVNISINSFFFCYGTQGRCW